jgi:hypothetical protein
MSFGWVYVALGHGPDRGILCRTGSSSRLAAGVSRRAPPTFTRWLLESEVAAPSVKDLTCVAMLGAGPHAGRRQDGHLAKGRH